MWQCKFSEMCPLRFLYDFREYGKCVDVLGTKDSTLGAVTPCAVPTPEAEDPVALIQTVLGDIPKIAIHGHSLGITLTAYNYVHPSLMYQKWKVRLTASILYPLSNENHFSQYAFIKSRPCCISL